MGFFSDAVRAFDVFCMACSGESFASECDSLPRLHRHVHVMRENADLGMRANEARREMSRMRARVTKTCEPRDPRVRSCGAIPEIGSRRESSLAGGRQFCVAKAVDGLPEQHDLFRARGNPTLAFCNYFDGGPIALWPARVRHHAEGAALVATFHGR